MIRKRSTIVAGHKTSVSMEDAFWSSMKEIARSQHVKLSELVGDINTKRVNGNLSSAIRLFVLAHYRERTSAIVPDARIHAPAGRPSA